jgi:enoyl-CoA hydratase/carnithine racemase
MELVVNVTLVVAGRGAVFGLPEVRRGVVAFAGALPRLVRTVGRQRAVELAITGRMLGPEEGREWGFVNRVVDGDVVVAAVEMAGEIGKGSPEEGVGRIGGVELGWECGVEEGTKRLLERWAAEVVDKENYKEGLRAFVEKREPKWVARSKL